MCICVGEAGSLNRGELLGPWNSVQEFWISFSVWQGVQEGLEQGGRLLLLRLLLQGRLL